ncbi:DUF6090 family protein [Polaribacter sp.]|uniref:DUF6090 family protein n=1 Tax=Polaribacter sp. TaxID=1920175 RepID=UPI004047A8E5
MLKFFRKIRQRLLSENKFNRYLIYAIGEIVLVVIGILIALQINNWNEARKADLSEYKALVALKNEFEQNIDRFQKIIQKRDSAQTDLRSYFDIITNDSIPLDEKVKAKTVSYFGGTWGVQNTVLNGLVNSGAIENIKNDTLKTLLASWPNFIQRWKDEEETWRRLNEKFQDYERVKVRRGIPRPKNEKRGYIFKDSWEQHYKRMGLIVNDLEYQNFIASDIQNLSHQSFISDRIMENYQKIIMALNIEIMSRE